MAQRRMIRLKRVPNNCYLYKMPWHLQITCAPLACYQQVLFKLALSAVIGYLCRGDCCCLLYCSLVWCVKTKPLKSLK
ncbi:hypothetical protein K449DRAFT_37296 [Hypoxylon sp. EC38]|nr:hypothetical protein K449DRAFT_37296 [Hypoxylon sp. EC38]